MSKKDFAMEEKKREPVSEFKNEMAYRKNENNRKHTWTGKEQN
jgi:hypothetical protein